MRALRVGLYAMALAAALGAMVALLLPRASAILIEAPVVVPVGPADAGHLAVTLTVRNSGGPDWLDAVEAPEAFRATLMGGQAGGALAIPAGGSPSLALDGAHGMLLNVQGALEEGRLIPVTLTFREAGPVTVRARLMAPQPASGDGLGSDPVGHMHGGSLVDVPSAGAPTVSMTVERDGSGWRILAMTERFRFTPGAIDGAHVPGEGHGHLYLGGLKLGRMTGPEMRIGALPKGRHELRLTLNSNDHQTYAVDGVPIAATVMIEQP